MDDIKLNECNISINNKKIELNYPIKMIEKIDDLYIILLNIPTRTKLGLEELNNIICYNTQGEFIWRIDNKLPNSIISKEQAPYVAIQIQDRVLKATDFMGRRFQVSFVNGRLFGCEIVR